MDFLNQALVIRGGPVMWVLLVIGIVGFVTFLERTLFLHKRQLRTNDFLAGIQNLVRKRRVVEALTVCEEAPGPVAAVVKAALLQLEQGEEKMRMSIQSAAVIEIPVLERRVETLGAIARVSTMIGLLGTLLGMAQSYFDLGQRATQGFPTFDQFLAGLGDALFSTAIGLAIAIMATLAHHFLQGRVRVLVHDMEYAGHKMMQFLLFDLPEEDEEGLLGEETEEEAEGVAP